MGPSKEQGAGASLRVTGRARPQEAGLPLAPQAGQLPRSCPGSPLGRQWPGQSSGSDCVSQRQGIQRAERSRKAEWGKGSGGGGGPSVGPWGHPRAPPPGDTLVPQGGKQTPPCTTSWKPWASSSAHPGWNPPSVSSAQGNSPGRNKELGFALESLQGKRDLI